MPFIKVETNVTASDKTGTAKALSSLAADLLGKPEKYVLAVFEDGKTLLHGGTAAPAAYVILDSIGLPEGKTGELSASICSFLESALGIPGDRVYIAFGNIEGRMFGWNGSTF